MAFEICVRCGAKNRVDERMAMARQAVCGNCGEELGRGGAKRAERADEATVVVVTDGSFERVILGAQDGRPVLLDCWAAWCAPCRMIAPLLDELAAEARGRYRVAKLNVDENPQTAARLGIRSLPTLLFFKDGNLVDRLVGAHNKAVIASRLNAHLS